MGARAEDLLERHGENHPIWAYAGLDDVRAAMGETGYPAERTHYVQGLVEEHSSKALRERLRALPVDLVGTWESGPVTVATVPGV